VAWEGKQLSVVIAAHIAQLSGLGRKGGSE
jgi:hypothetical protein